MNTRRRAERQDQLRRIDAWLLDFRRNSPFLFTMFVVGIGCFIAGMLLSILDWTP